MEAPLIAAHMDEHLVTHLVNPTLLRVDDFGAFFESCERVLINLIETATGKPLIRRLVAEPDEQSVKPETESQVDFGESE